MMRNTSLLSCMKKQRTIILEMVCLTIVVVASFSFYGLVNFPFLNSDHCLNVLIADNFSLPRDFYCWGQNRGGMLIPLISQPLLWIGLSPLWAVSLSTYLILLLGYFAFASFLRKPFFRLIFAGVWFLPLFSFNYLLSCPIGMQYSLLGMGLYFIKPVIFNKRSIDSQRLYFYFRLGIAFSLFLLAVWVSDLSLVNLGIGGVVLWIHHYKESGTWKISREISLSLAIFLLATVVFLVYAKNTAMSRRGDYSKINNIHDVFMSLKVLWNRLVSILIPNEKDVNYVTTAYSWMSIVLLVIGLIAVIIGKPWKTVRHAPWIPLFLADAIGIFGVCILSRWVFLNNVETRYFVSSYISLWMAVLLFAETHAAKVYKAGLLSVSLIGAFSGLHYLKTEGTADGKMIPLAKRWERFNTLGDNVGIIGGYWQSFVISGVHTATIKATPHDQAEFRNESLVWEVLKREKLFVISNDWFETYPNELYQYGHILRKSGSPFFIEGINVCAYKVTPGIFYPTDSVFSQTPKQYDPLIQQTILMPQFDSVSLKWIWKCPFYVAVGKIEVTFAVKLKAETTSSEPKIWKFEAWGSGENIKTIYCSADSLREGGYHSVTIPYSSPFGYTEFHITAPALNDSLWIKNISFDLKSLK